MTTHNPSLLPLRNRQLAGFARAAPPGFLALVAAVWVQLAIGFSTCAAASGTELSLEVWQPPYRQSVYATQREQVVVVRVQVPAELQSRVHVIRGSLLDADGHGLAGTTPELQPATEVRFDLAALPPAPYVVEVRACDAAGVSVATNRISIRKLGPAPGSEIRLDEHRNLVVDGAPSVQIGWYGGVRLDDPRPDVVALQNVVTALVVTHPDKSPVATLYRDHGIRTVVNLEPPRLLYTFELWKQPGHPVPTEHTRLSAPSPECREMLQKMVELLQDEPGLFGWYIADEPEINNYRADYLEAYCQTLRELDPYHPVVVTNDTLEGIERIGYRCCDILAPDPYSPKPDYVPRFLQQANRVLQRGQGLMLTPWHAAAHTHFTAPYGSDPPYAYRVMRGQYLATLAAGGRGFVGYTSDFFLPEPRLRIGLPPLWREVRFLESFLATGGETLQPVSVPLDSAAPGVTVDNAAGSPDSAAVPSDNAQILGWLGTHGPHLALILMNGSTTPRQCTVRHPALRMSSLDVISEGRIVPIREGTLSDEIPAGEGRVYSNDPRGRQLPTVAEIEADIERFQRETVKPGNLAHASRGVQARASQGTTPWFAQVFCYAINGITDDEGWHVTHAALPQWLELAMPEPVPIARVRLYTPNLRDFDLQFRAADSTTYQAEVRGNLQDVADIVLPHAVSTLKLRLIARSVRDHANPPHAMVREIEAYTEAGAATGPPLTLARIDAPPEPAGDDAAPIPPASSLWSDDFSAFQHKPRHYEGPDSAWVFNPQEFHARYNESRRRLVCKVTSNAGYAAMSRMLPCDGEHRFLQVSVPEIRGDGYRWLNVGFSDPSGKAAARAAVHTIKPGRYTADTHALHEIFRSPEQRQGLLSIYLMQDIEYDLEEVSLVSQPRDGLAVTLVDGSPLPRVLNIGDEILFRLFLDSPATDAVVELLRDSWYEPVRINGEPYVQLWKAGHEKDGRYWSASVRLGPQTDTFQVTGYPVLFRAVMTGGARQETLSTVTVDIQKP
jgi:hypothetical protein